MAKPQPQQLEAAPPSGVNLLEGWTHTRLKVIAKIALGKMLDRAKRTRGTPLKYLRNANVRWDGFHLDDLLEMPFEDHEFERYAVFPGDLLVCEGGEPGRAAIWPRKAPPIMYQKALLRVRPVAGIEPRWIMFSLRHDATAGTLETYFTGSTIRHFPQQALLRYRLPLAPLAEQKRIVAKIEALIARVDAARVRLTKVPAMLKRFRQAVLAAACSGRLTAAWRESNPDVEPASATLGRIRESHDKAGFGFGGKAAEPTDEAHDLTQESLPESWDIARLMELCRPGRPIVYGILKPGPDVADGVPYVRVADFPEGRIELSTVRRTTHVIATQYDRATLAHGDVLLSIRGTVGRVCRVPQELAGANITQDTARITAHREVDPEYVAVYLRCPSVDTRFKRALRGVAVRGINIGDVRALQVALPPLEEQREIVRRVEALFKLAEAIEERV
ncbi:MAG: restriction endonuclease subunit S, partial [Candidatus Binataceae bacterium]